jgi:hypothetical protein
MNKLIALRFFVATSIVFLTLTQSVLSGERSDSHTITLGNHSLCGAYEFHADGVVEIDGVPSRGFWEAGRFDADCEGNITNGVEYSSLLDSNDESVIDQNFTFKGSYVVNNNGTAKASVKVTIAPGVVIEKFLWFVLNSVGKDGIANGFAGGHAEAEIGGGVHGNTRTHVGTRIITAK